ncbi:ATPase, T2SS/T4P/T4SS family [Providencia rettgeri]|uniref:ATPase, T2SS/T4P/T4SS family n=1 Tax=Providencia rettgeri TaxID=587 RepID=UPI001419A6EC|nr:ATPase, T2SS/T4P/T4SS family [Providencia rettgeri]NIH07049.1 CpaF family protein [Providencia rettgeri]
MILREYPFGQVECFSDMIACAWDQVHDEMLPIMSLYNDPDVTDIMVNRYDNIWKVVGGKPYQTPYSFGSENSLKSFAAQIATVLKQPYSTTGNYKLDDLIEPILDARFPDGSRIMATDNIISPQGTTISLRKVPKRFLTQDDFLKSEMFNEEMLSYLIDVIKQRKTFLTSGNTGSGKTSLLRFLANYIDKLERVITVEDTQELHIQKLFPLGIAMEAAHRKDVNATLPQLVNATMRAQPDRVWVGEVRTAQALAAFYLTCTSGTTGNATTMHSFDVRGAFKKLQWLISSELNVGYEVAGDLVKEEIEVVVQCRRSPVFGRKITEIVEVRNGILTPIFLYDEKTNSHHCCV